MTPTPAAPTTPTTTVADAIAEIAAASTSSQTNAEPPEIMKIGGPPVAPSADGKKGAEEKPRPTAKGPSRHIDVTPTIGRFRSNEILAHNLSDQGRQQLRAAQKYILSQGHADSVTVLTLPDYADVREELLRLRAGFPDQLFGLNYLYRSYRGAGENGPAPILPRGSPEGGCDAARCYGPGMIGWHSELAACARNVVVGIIDTGLDQKHSAVKRLHLIQHPADANRRGENWHGTGVAALLAGTRQSSTPGLIPEAQYVIVDAFYASQEEAAPKGQEQQTVTDTDHLVWALETLEQKHAQVINMSLVGPSDPAIHAVIRKMAHSGVVFVAAAGNGGPAGAEAFPAAYQEVIAVTAVDRNKHGYAEANHGGYIDVAAPGVRVWTALPDERQGFLSGTSFATPFVTAIVAATYNSTPMRTAVGDKQRALNSKNEVLGRIAVEKLGTGEAGTRDRVFGLGLVQAPRNCSPSSRSEKLIAERGSSTPPAKVSPPAETDWQAQVHHASSAR